jgi:hypothetical protein
MEKAWRIKVAQAIVNRGKKEKGAGMTQDEMIEMAKEAGFDIDLPAYENGTALAIKLAKLVAAKAIAKLESQEPVAWLLTEKNINSLQVDSIQLLIDRLKHAHHTDLCVRINGQDEWFQADWLKHMVRATPPQRTWVGLTDEEIEQSYETTGHYQKLRLQDKFAVYALAKAIEAKLKEKNT